MRHLINIITKTELNFDKMGQLSKVFVTTMPYLKQYLHKKFVRILKLYLRLSSSKDFQYFKIPDHNHSSFDVI